MNKAVLVLEDGRVLTGKTTLENNAFGQVELLGTQARLTAQSQSFSFDLDQAHQSSNPLVGKIVMDTLPIEYHMYDVKNTVF